METQSTGLQPLNCINCGAPLSFGATECQYCHTPYLLPMQDENIDLNFEKPSLSFHFDHGKLEMTMGTGSLFSAVRCPHCGNTVAVSEYCSKCGNALPHGIPCPHCGQISKFGVQCSHCGKPLGRVIASKDFELNDLRDLGNVLSGTVSPGIAAASTPASYLEQIKAIALRLLSQTGNHTPFDLRQTRDGDLEIIVGDSSYTSVEEIPDANVKNALQQAVAEWQKQD